MIIYKKGNILDSDCEGIVNPVNCYGVMGKGLALEMRKKYPQIMEKYKKDCKSNFIRIGTISIGKISNSTNPKYIFNLPTKNHYRDKSEYHFIVQGLIALETTIIVLDLKSIAIPALGCGLGGLNWEKVKYLMETFLDGNYSDYKKEVAYNIYLPLCSE